MKKIEELFQEPDYNPFDSKSRFQSGFDELVDQVRELSMKEPLKIRITLSSLPVESDIEGLAKNALSRYCTHKINECEREIHELRSQGKRDLQWAVSLSFIFFLGAFFIAQLGFLPEFIIYLLATGFGILAWVVLWSPLDNLLYEWRPYRRSKRIYKYIQSSELGINSASPD